MKKLIIAFSLVLIAAFSFAAYTTTNKEAVKTEKFDDKPKQQTEKTEATAQTSNDKEATEQKTEKKDCSATTSGCSKDKKSSGCDKK